MKNFDFGDINLVPKFFDGVSRADLDTSVELGGRKFKLPAIPANMESVITEELCMKLAENGYFYIMHRFNIDQKEFIKKMHNKNLIASISLGVKETDLKLAEELVEEGLIPEYLTIDIAHGHSLMMKNALEHYRKLFPVTFIIAGNIATKDAGLDLMKWGADCVKVGVAPGFVCTTYMESGFGTRLMQASKIKEISSLPIPIIADGGISMPGEIAKALVLGAHMCMCGNLFSGYKDSPGKWVTVDGKHYKEYYGSASAHNTGKKGRIEGTKKLVEYKDITLLERCLQLEESLQSAISYAGGKELKDLLTVKYEFNK